MHIHIAEKVLKDTKFSIEKHGDRLKINGYKGEEITAETCIKCSLKTLKNNETIYLNELEVEKKCSCKPSIAPLITFKVDASKTEKITIV